jgi:hypothetical protein
MPCPACGTKDFPKVSSTFENNQTTTSRQTGNPRVTQVIIPFGLPPTKYSATRSFFLLFFNLPFVHFFDFCAFKSILFPLVVVVCNCNTIFT